jgi:hypothetical protein
MCFAPQQRAPFRHLNLQKWSEHVVLLNAFNMFNSKAASRHNGVHFSTTTSKSGPNMWCCWHIKMCFAPQRRLLFQHLNFQKCSEHGVLCTLWLRNALRATTACKSWSLIRPDGSAPVTLVNLLVDPPEPLILGKTPSFATLLFYSLILSSALLSTPGISSRLISSRVI